MQSTTSRNFSDLSEFLTEIPTSGLSVSLNLPSPPSRIYYRDRAIPFGDSGSGDNAVCAKATAVLREVCLDLIEKVHQALIQDTYVGDGGVGSDSLETLLNLQSEIHVLLGKGGYQVKSWEFSGTRKC